MSVIHFTTRSKDVFPYWTKAPEIGLRRIMTLIALAPKTGLTGSKTPVVRDRNGRVIDGLVVDSSDAKEFVERLTKPRIGVFRFRSAGKNAPSVQSRFIRRKVGRVPCPGQLKLMLLSKIFKTKRTESYWRNMANSARIIR